MMILTHLFCAATIFGSQFAPARFFEGSSVVMILAMTSQVLNITRVCNYMFTES